MSVEVVLHGTLEHAAQPLALAHVAHVPTHHAHMYIYCTHMYSVYKSRIYVYTEQNGAH